MATTLQPQRQLCPSTVAPVLSDGGESSPYLICSSTSECLHLKHPLPEATSNRLALQAS